MQQCSNHPDSECRYDSTIGLGPVFAQLFQQSIDTGEIPKKWSLANICPLFKKGDRSLACNSRPFSCVPCKLLEHIVCSNIMARLDEHKLVFRKRHSCETQLITVINDWAKILDKGGQVCLGTSRKLLIHPSWTTKKQAVWLWYWWKDSEMDIFFSLFQAAASCSKWNKIRLSPRFVGCPSGHRS